MTGPLQQFSAHRIGNQEDCGLDKGKRHVYVVPRCVRIGAHDMRPVDEVLSCFAAHARQGDLQLDFNAEAVGDGADTNGAVDRGIGRDSDFVACGDELHCAN